MESLISLLSFFLGVFQIGSGTRVKSRQAPIQLEILEVDIVHRARNIVVVHRHLAHDRVLAELFCLKYSRMHRQLGAANLSQSRLGLSLFLLFHLVLMHGQVTLVSLALLGTYVVVVVGGVQVGLAATQQRATLVNHFEG